MLYKKKIIIVWIRIHIRLYLSYSDILPVNAANLKCLVASLTNFLLEVPSKLKAVLLDWEFFCGNVYTGHLFLTWKWYNIWKNRWL